VVDDVRDWIREHNGEALLLGPEFDAAILGLAERCGQPTLVVYDSLAVIGVFEQQGMSPDEASEFFGFNVLGAWHGPNTPLFLLRNTPLD
jgi:hypothetical protein